MTSATVPLLYSYRRCPYAMRARMAVQLHQPEQARRLWAPLKAHLESNGNQRALRRVWLVEAMVVPPDEACV